MTERETEISEPAIERLVRTFYGRVRQDAVLGPVFTRALGESEAAWEAHFARLSAFWSSVMRCSGRYHGDPFSVHLRLPDIAPAMFERWLALFHTTCADLFTPEIAAAFAEKAERIARSLRMGLFERLPARHRLRGAVSRPTLPLPRVGGKGRGEEDPNPVTVLDNTPPTGWPA